MRLNSGNAGDSFWPATGISSQSRSSSRASVAFSPSERSRHPRRGIRHCRIVRPWGRAGHSSCCPRDECRLDRRPERFFVARLSANQTTSFFFVSGSGSRAYSAKLLAGTRQRLSGFSQPRQCGEAVLRMLVTPRAAVAACPTASSSARASCPCFARPGQVVGKDARHRRKVAGEIAQSPRQLDDRGLPFGNGVKIAHGGYLVRPSAL